MMCLLPCFDVTPRSFVSWKSHHRSSFTGFAYFHVWSPQLFWRRRARRRSWTAGKKIFQHSACFLLSLGRCCWREWQTHACWLVLLLAVMRTPSTPSPSPLTFRWGGKQEEGQGKSQDATLAADAAALFRMQGVKGLWKKNLRQAGRHFFFSFSFLIYSNHRFGTVDLTLVPQKLWPLKFIRPFAIHWFLSISLWPCGLWVCECV